MEYAIGVPLSCLGIYVFMRLTSYAICKSIKQVFGNQTKENQNGKEEKRQN